ncbi:penicillin-binding transpeptidase domain-containing protein [Halalkalibacillus halophilus]|uniref:penicillin-binding transpeptidase domain-containing protein n=1 Tax=Halalkalibacillus halophilus TaxID=392827 RepID=UPI0004166A64|nr:penicillin-binding transpeptidase domain-containing protein [Halalkalibacillus halophilus]
MKKTIVVTFLTGCLFLIACNGEEEEESLTPYDYMEEYVSHWENEEYRTMYDEYLTPSTKDSFTYEDFGERYENVYNDLNVSDVEVSYQEEEITDEELEEIEESASYSIPVEISFNTSAGNVSFQEDVMMEWHTEEVEQEDEMVEEEYWLMEWEPRFMLPGLEEGDAIRINNLEATRGDILDRNQNMLATNGEVYEIGVTLQSFDEGSLGELASILNLSEQYIENKYNQSWVEESHFVPIRNVLLQDEEMMEEATSISGVSSNVIVDRVYPYAEVAAHLTGYIGPINEEELEEFEGSYTSTDLVGKRGLEQLFEEDLKGQNGIEIAIEKEDGSQETVVKQDREDGDNVELTIDMSVQESIYEIVQDEKGTAVTLDPQSGEVTSLLSFPTFDPNQFVLGMTNSQYQELAEDEDQPMVNRFSATYSPGSTMKLITSLIGLHHDAFDPDEIVEIEGKRWSPDESSWGDYQVTRVYEQHTEVDLETAMKYSDNIYFAMRGMDIGADAFQQSLEDLGFQERLPFTYPLTISQISNSGEFDSEVQLADSAYGQGQLLINMLHLTSLYGGIANDGTFMQPLLRSDEEQAVWIEDYLDEEGISRLQNDLRKVVSEGSSQSIDLDNREIAGKTGTAELKSSHEDENNAQNGVFVSYDQSNPDMVLGLLIENVEDIGGSGYTVDLSKEIYEVLDE